MVAVEPVLAVLIGPELSTEVVGGLVLGVLEVIFAVGTSLPDVEDGVGDGLAGLEITYHTMHLADLAVGVCVLNDGAAIVAEGSVG